MPWTMKAIGEDRTKSPAMANARRQYPGDDRADAGQPEDDPDRLVALPQILPHVEDDQVQRAGGQERVRPHQQRQRAEDRLLVEKPESSQPTLGQAVATGTAAISLALYVRAGCRRSPEADETERDDRDDIRRGRNEQRPGPKRAEEDAGQHRAEHEREGERRLQLAVRVQDLVAVDQVGHRRHIGHPEDHAEPRPDEGQRVEHPERLRQGPPEDRNQDEAGQAAEMAIDHQAAAVESVDERTGDQPSGQGAETVDRRDLSHPRDRIRRLQHEQGQGDQGNGVSEDRERLARPEDEEIAVVDQGMALPRAGPTVGGPAGRRGARPKRPGRRKGRRFTGMPRC